MDLAATLGCTVAELAHRMTATELALWLRYHGRKGLPWRRIEIHLARVAQIVATSMGGADANLPLSTYLVDPAPTTTATDDKPNDDDSDDDDPDAGDAFADVGL